MKVKGEDWAAASTGAEEGEGGGRGVGTRVLASPIGGETKGEGEGGFYRRRVGHVHSQDGGHDGEGREVRAGVGGRVRARRACGGEATCATRRSAAAVGR